MFYVSFTWFRLIFCIDTDPDGQNDEMIRIPPDLDPAELYTTKIFNFPHPTGNLFCAVIRLIAEKALEDAAAERRAAAEAEVAQRIIDQWIQGVLAEEARVLAEQAGGA